MHVSEKVGYEADDIIATIAKDASKKGFEVVIISSDKDLMQLVDDKIVMFDPMKSKIIGAKEVEEKFMVTPSQVLDVLSLMGDASDNVPGVRGIGPKIAAELISNYGTLENLL
jgi:DNA polymerase-1